MTMANSTFVRGAGRLAALALVFPLTGCITVEPPDKPIEINLNVAITQEVLVRLQRDVEQMIQQNPQAFPQSPADKPKP